MLQRNEKPQFCIITPTAYLEKYASQSSMHLVLAHLVDKDDTYAEFYAGRNEFKIMDNGAFELGCSYNPDMLVELGQKCKADAIVLPDYPGQDWKKTIGAAEELIPQVKEAGFYTFFCPQSRIGDWDGWVSSYRWGTRNVNVDIIGMSILALPNALPHIPRAYARVVATALLQQFDDFDYGKYHHYLGLNAGPALEIPPLIAMEALDSCDSSNPVWSAILGYEYTDRTDSYLTVNKKQLLEVDFDYPYYGDHWDKTIQNNIDMTLKLFEK